VRRFAIVGLITLASCSERATGVSTRAAPLETGIARELTLRFGQPVTTRCTFVAGIPAACEAHLADRTRLPLAITSDGDGWLWRVAGRVIEVRPLAAHVDAELAELGLPYTATCGDGLQVVAAGGRISCKLSNGGAAYLDILADGTTSLELALDPDSARARGEPVTPEQESDLERRSRALERLAGESDGEDEVGGAAPGDSSGP
jgi:hypothetical protein